MSLFGKSESYLGVDIGAGGIKVVELRKTKGRPQLWTYGILDTKLDIHVPTFPGPSHTAVPGDEEKQKPTPVLVDPRVPAYAELLRYVIDQARVTTKHATASLPVSQVFHAVVTLPLVPEKDLDREVRAKVAKMLPRSLEEMQVVHQRIPSRKNEAPKDIKLLVTAAPKLLVQFYTDVFAAAGLILDELETEAFAIERALVGRDTATVMVVDIGAERTNFFIVDNGLPVTHRSISIGGQAFDAALHNALGVDEKCISEIKYDISRTASADIPFDLFIPMIDPIAKEIQYGIDLFTHQTGNEGRRPEKIILAGGAALFPPVLAILRRAFPVQSVVAFVGDPWARVVYQQGLKSVLDTIGSRMAIAIGLALRHLSP